MENFANFSNFYSLSKTLRFELRPVWNTKKLLETENPFEKDKIIDEVYENIIKAKLDVLHRKFIEKSLENFHSNLLTNNLTYLYQTNKKEFEKIQKKLAKEIANHMNKQKIKLEKNWQDIEIDGIKFLWDKKVLDLLKSYFWNEIYENTDFEAIKWKSISYIIDKYFKWFFTYLIAFNENRKNFYKDDLKFWRVSTRIVKDNLPKFLENIIFFEKIKDKVNLSEQEKEIFNIQNFSKYLNQEGIDKYNEIIGQINSKINEYNQKHHLKWKNKIKSLQILYKQILWESSKQDIFNFTTNNFQTDNELLDALKEFIKAEKQAYNNSVNFIIDNFESFDLSWIWIKKWKLKILSNKYLQNWSVLENLLPKQDENWKEKWIDEIVSLNQIEDVVNIANEEIFKERLKDNLKWDTNFEKFINLYLEELEKLWTQKDKFLKEIEVKIFNQDFQKTKEQKQAIKDYLDTILEIERNLNIFSLIKWQWEKQEEIQAENKDTDFYNALQSYFDLEIPKFYNAVRNYLTQKPWNKSKTKINFNSPTLLAGWDKNKETQNYGIILRKYDNERQDYDHFLAIMKKWFHTIFDENKNPSICQVDWDYFEKMEYKLLPWPNKMLPKVFFSASRIKEFAPSKEILEIRKKESFKQGDNFSLKDLYTWIDFMKKSLYRHPEWKEFNFKFKDTEKYENIKDFYSDVESQWYKLDFVKVDYNKILNLVNEEKLYLFQIWNKDFSKYSHWKENLHTIYRKALFEKENFEWDYKPVYKLNWEAEIFFRQKSNIKVEEKILKDGTKIIKKKRYLQDKILFHVPITLNFVNKWVKKVNDEVKKYILENKMKIIWIDRGEKHLLYLSLIDENWNLIKTESLNCILNKLPSGEDKEVCYIDKLVEKEQSRDTERKTWDEIETIKELKEWYISQIVNYIVDLAIKENAIIVLEDLNWWFKRSRQKIERQIYQKFETALAKKLNYTIFKDKAWNDIWWKYKAYQLTPEVNQYQDIYSQTWILFFTQAAYTSTTCPVCGFRKNIYLKYENINKSLEFIKKLDIDYKNWDFYFTYQIEERQDKKKNKLKTIRFTISTKGQKRIYYFKDKENKLEKRFFDMTSYFKDLFEKNWLPLENLKTNILTLWKSLSANFYKNFIFWLNLLLQLRNSDSENNIDYIQCPRCNFDSRNWFNWKDFNWDANWAYNIARRWKMIIDKIRKWEKKLWISLVEWDNKVLKGN
jgi:hypothetical protein